MFGAFAPLPLRLTAHSSTDGWTAGQQSRLANDLVAAWRSLPLAVMTVEVGASSVSLVSYHGRNGAGSVYAPELTYTSATQPCSAVWEHSYDDDLELPQTWVVRTGSAELEWSGSGAVGCSVRQIPGDINGIDLVVSAGVTTPYRVTIDVFGDWGTPRNIGDYAGDVAKENCSSEEQIPYAAQWYHAIRSARGSAYSKLPLTIVDFENVAISRMMATAFSRNAEKLVSNSIPGRADEKLDYWVEVLGIPTKPDDPKWMIRQRCRTHYEAALGPTPEAISAALTNLLGDAFVQLHVYEGDDLDTPPIPTYWPAGAHGDSAYTVGGVPWASRRSLLRVEVLQPPGMQLSEFLQLMDVQMFELLDRMLPAWVDWTWSEGSDGFRVGVDRIGVDGL